jgi:hypothetical protein
MSASSPSLRPRDGRSHRFGFLIPLALVAVALLALLPRAGTEACVPQDPVRVRLGETVYAIPAVLLPNLFLDRGMVPVVRQDSSDGIEAFSRAGSRLYRWYCESEDGAPIPIKSFSVHKREIADAVAQGELDYHHLTRIGLLSLRSGSHYEWPGLEDMVPESLPGGFRVHCNPPFKWTLPQTGPRTLSHCTAYALTAANTVATMKFYLETFEGGPTINGREDWPEIAREAEQLIRSMQVAPE